MTIYKIGGSLLDLPGLTETLRQVLTRHAGSPALLVPGGGTPANAVRDWDRVHELRDEPAHDLALAAMDLSGLLLATLVPELRLVRSVQQVQMAADDGVTGLLCADCFLKSAEAQGHEPLERSWRVTSDSIAAWTARVVGADELVLVKSTSLPVGLSLSEAARSGFVDEAFPEVAQPLNHIGWINARRQPIVVEPWIAPRI